MYGLPGLLTFALRHTSVGSQRWLTNPRAKVLRTPREESLVAGLVSKGLVKSPEDAE